MKRIINRIVALIKHIKIIKKLMLIYIIGGLIPLLLVSIFLSANTRSILLKRAIDEATSNTERLKERLLDVFQISINVSDGLYLDKQLESIIHTNYTNQLDIIKDLNSFTKIDDYLRLYPEIASVRIYVDNQTLLDNSQIIKITQSQKNSHWYQLALEKDGRMAYIYKYDEVSRSNYLSLVRLVKNNKGEHLGILVINISNRYVDKLIASEPYNVLLTLDNQSIVLFTDSDFEGSNVKDNEELVSMSQLPTGINDFEFKHLTYKIIVDEFGKVPTKNNFKLFTLIPLDTLGTAAKDAMMTSAFMILISVIISIFMVYILSKAFSSRVKTLKDDMHKVASGNFEVHSEVIGRDELGELANDLNSMVKSIQKLIHEVYEVRLQKEQLGNKQREAEFKMLASQINPHFLYNALETIRMKAYVNGQKEIAVVVKKLARIMRRNLSISNNEVSLQSEIDLIQHYLEIQQFRFHDKVSFHFDVICDVDSYTILPLLLQPLVENAFVHGLERKLGKGHIEICIKDDHRYLYIDVMDDGLGIDEKKLHNLWERLENDAHSIDGSIGLTNVNQRIKIYYGEEYHLSIQSKISEGTKASIILPSCKGVKRKCIESS